VSVLQGVSFPKLQGSIFIRWKLGPYWFCFTRAWNPN